MVPTLLPHSLEKTANKLGKYSVSIGNFVCLDCTRSFVNRRIFG